jgi:pimeloyl-ACP methyl ester carboxylesterase
MSTQTETSTVPVADYVNAGGLQTYYEVQGSGDALVMLHGGFASVATFAGFTPLVAERYRVYSPERRGHGRMPDVAGPITYEVMADDTIAFIEALGLGPAHVVGWSDGANVGMITAIRRPDLVRKLVLIGTAVNISGAKPWAQALTEQLTVEHLPPMLIEEYAALSPWKTCAGSPPRPWSWPGTTTSSPSSTRKPCGPRYRTASWPSCPAPPTVCRWRSPTSSCD